MSIETLSHDQSPAASMPPRSEVSVGELVATYLADIGVEIAYGVISIHNMPILDAIARQGRIRFVPARGEAGALNMADAYARVSGKLGVAFTSTGTAAGNAAGAQVEAQTAGTPILHITTQVDRVFMDRDRAAIHDVPDQAAMLRAISKGYLRIWESRGVLGVLDAAVRMALSAPAGPATVEIPVDVQREFVPAPACIRPPVVDPIRPDEMLLDIAAGMIARARRPILWLGGGARAASSAATALVERGVAVVTSTHGRAVVPENHPWSLGAFNMTPASEAIYKQADLMLVVGSRLRGNETFDNRMQLPRPLLQIDADPTQNGRNYATDVFMAGDARLALEGLLARLPETLNTNHNFLHDISIARAQSEGMLRSALGPYQTIADDLLARVSAGAHPFVRDVTISNSTFGNRYVTIARPELGVHALGGGIGQGIAMAIGAALAGEAAKTIALIGDGGSMLALGEFLTAVDEGAEIVFVLMNDEAYGVIQNIQDVQFEGRRHYSNLSVPNFSLLAKSFGLQHRAIDNVETFGAALDWALNLRGPVLLEVEMTKIGPFASAFAGPPAGAAGGPA